MKKFIRISILVTLLLILFGTVASAKTILFNAEYSNLFNDAGVAAQPYFNRSGYRKIIITDFPEKYDKEHYTEMILISNNDKSLTILVEPGSEYHSYYIENGWTTTELTNGAYINFFHLHTPKNKTTNIDAIRLNYSNTDIPVTLNSDSLDNISLTPEVYIYSPNEKKLVPYTSYYSYTSTGNWKLNPCIYLYAPNGDSAVVEVSQVEEVINDGWFKFKFPDPVTVYAPDGRTETISKKYLEAWKAVGWYEEAVATVYAADGRTLVIPTSHIEAYKAVGWLTEEQYKLTRLDDYAAMTIYDAIYRESKIPPNYNLNSVYVKLDQEKYFYAVIGYSFESGFGTTHTEGIIKGLNPDSGKISEDFISIYKDLVEKGEDNYKRALENASKYPYDRIWAILLESSEKSLPNTKAQLAEYQAWLLSPASYGFQKLDANHIKNLVSSIQQ